MSIFCICIRPDILLPVILKFNKLSAFFSRSILFSNDFSFTAADCKVTRPKVYHSNCEVIIYQRWPFSVNLKITLPFLARCQFENFQGYGLMRGANKIDVAVSKMKGSFRMIGVVIILHPNTGLDCSLSLFFLFFIQNI